MKIVPQLDLKAEYAEIRELVKKRVQLFFESGRYILAKEVEEFENSFSKFIGTKYAVGVASGTDAILLPLMAHGVEEGDEIITTPFTFIATATSITRLGARPVFVDIEPDTYNINPDLIKKKITRKTRGIIAVHLYGNPCRIDAIQSIAKQNNLFVIEDCAQACGSIYRNKKVGALGNAGAFSFYPTKTLGAAGDAGIVTTNDKTISEKIRSLRHHGDDGRHHVYNHVSIGINSRLDEIQAAILNVKLKFLPKWNQKRRQAASYYSQSIQKMGSKNIVIPIETDGGTSVYHQYILRILNGKRDKVMAHLRQNGIQSAVYYPTPLHKQPCFGYLGFKSGDFPIAEKATKEVLSLPLYPQITKSQQNQVINYLSKM